MFGVILTGTWTVDKIESPSVYEATTDGDIPSKWKYKLISKKGKTLLEFEVTYEIPKNVLAQVTNSPGTCIFSGVILPSVFILPFVVDCNC